jgi:hypothetical protein
MVLALLCWPAWAGLIPAHRVAGVTPLGRAGRGLSMTVSLSKQEAAEEAYYRRWFWDQAEAAIDARFASASKRELKRVREYIAINREDAPLPKKLAKNPQYECIGGFFPGLTVTPYLDCSGQPWGGLAEAYPAIKREVDGLLAREQARAAAPCRASCHAHTTSPRLASPRLASPRPASRLLRCAGCSAPPDLGLTSTHRLARSSKTWASLPGGRLCPSTTKACYPWP